MLHIWILSLGSLSFSPNFHMQIHRSFHMDLQMCLSCWVYWHWLVHMTWYCTYSRKNEIVLQCSLEGCNLWFSPLLGTYWISHLLTWASHRLTAGMKQCDRCAPWLLLSSIWIYFDLVIHVSTSLTHNIAPSAQKMLFKLPQTWPW